MTEYQESLFAAVAMRSLTYRVFGMPVFVLSDLPALARRLFRKPSVLLYFLLPPVAAVAVVFLAWLLAGILVFGPGLKAYELLLVAELRRGADTPLAAIRTNVFNVPEPWPQVQKPGPSPHSGSTIKPSARDVDIQHRSSNMMAS